VDGREPDTASHRSPTLFVRSSSRDFACISPKLLRIIALPPLRRASVTVPVSTLKKFRNPGAPKKEKNHEKIKRSGTANFLAGNDVCHRIFGAS
jgi:hypothetical protein